jgi:hypothetical protein
MENFTALPMLLASLGYMLHSCNAIQSSWLDNVFLFSSSQFTEPRIEVDVNKEVYNTCVTNMVTLG